MTNSPAGTMDVAAIRPSPDWTFGGPELQEVNREEYLQNALVNSAPAIVKDDSAAERERVAQHIRDRVNLMDPVMWGAHPVVGDPSVRYNFIEHPQGHLWLTLRWWSGGPYGYYFDLVDIETRKVITPPTDIHIRAEEEGDFISLDTIEELARLARGLPRLPGSGEQRYIVPHGSRIRIFQDIAAMGGEQLIAEVFAPIDDRYYPLNDEEVRRYYPISPYQPAT